MSDLSSKQQQFTRLIIKLISYGLDLGYEFTFGEALRSDEQAEINSLGQEGREKLATLISPVFADLAAKIRNNGKADGIRLSIHQDKLALDLNLFKAGLYLDKTSDHLILGEYWESLDPDCRWGGRFRDGNHYSMIHFGRM